MRKVIVLTGLFGALLLCSCSENSSGLLVAPAPAQAAQENTAPRVIAMICPIELSDATVVFEGEVDILWEVAANSKGTLDS